MFVGTNKTASADFNQNTVLLYLPASFKSYNRLHKTVKDTANTLHVLPVKVDYY